jgi:hypothetical protein
MKGIDVLPDDVLLEIFDFRANAPILRSPRRKTDVEVWLSLVHVCRRWRNLVFASPRRLNLQLCCTPETPVKDGLDVWPALPLIVIDNKHSSLFSCTDNVMAALGHSNRIREFSLSLTNWQLEQVSAAMQVSFPELTKLWLSSHGETMPVVPDSFLGGSAARLRSFWLFGIPYPALPNLLFSADHLADLSLIDIPPSGYISPEAMVASLSALPRLRMLTLEFKSPLSLPDRGTRHPPPPKRSILPVHHFFFKGTTEYLEDLVSRIDTPHLGNLLIKLFNQIDHDFPLLAQFINRTFKAPDEATVQFDDWNASVLFGIFRIFISCEPDWQLSAVTQVCSSSFSSTLEAVEDLYMECRDWQLVRKNINDAVENNLWLQLLLPFTAVKNLYLCKDFAPGIAGALKELAGDGITDVLPNMQNIFVDELVRESFEKNIGQFVVARRLSGYPVAISNWDKDTSDENKDPSDWDEDSSEQDKDSDTESI